jgi:malate synthase
MLLGRMRATCGRLGSRGLATAMPEMLAKPAAQYVNIGSGLEVDLELKRVVDDVIMPGTGVEPAAFWRGFGELVLEFGPRNRAALEERDRMQHALDHWHLSRRALGLPHDPVAYRALLIEIGYLIAPPAGAEPVKIRTANVDAELASVAGPQLVCPVDNARFIVNAANARWGSLLDALYGTDVVPGAKPTDGSYSAARGQAVFDEAHRILNKTFPLDGGAQWGGVQCLTVDAEGDLHASLRSGCNAPVGLMSEEQFVGFRGERSAPTSILLRNHGLHVELVIDRSSAIGATHKAGLADIQVEAALTAICDAEDSASAVDASDKARAYLNWHGLMARTLAVPLRKGGAMIERTMNPPRSWTSVEAGKAGSQIELPGSAVLLCRNVGLHMHTDVVRATDGGAPTPEHFLDAAVSILAAVHDFRGPSARRNSRAGSVYIVKPKMHAPREVALCADLFGRLEALVGLPALSVKMGMMDEERRATANLPEMMRAAQDRLVFINTGLCARARVRDRRAGGGGGWCLCAPAAQQLLAREREREWRVACTQRHARVGRAHVLARAVWRAKRERPRTQAAAKPLTHSLCSRLLCRRPPPLRCARPRSLSLDRTGDEIHSVMEAGPVVCKAEFKQAKWLVAYESANVATALQAGLLGRGQIGKGAHAHARAAAVPAQHGCRARLAPHPRHHLRLASLPTLATTCASCAPRRIPSLARSIDPGASPAALTHLPRFRPPFRFRPALRCVALRCVALRCVASRRARQACGRRPTRWPT